jgi:peroxiredoxin
MECSSRLALWLSGYLQKTIQSLNKINAMRLKVGALLFWAVAWTACQDEKPNVYKTGMEGKPIPAFSIQLLDSTSFVHSEDIGEGKDLVLFYFSTTCPYCRAQMRDMVNNIEKFKNEKLCILTNDKLHAINAFADYFKLKQLNNVIVGRDTGNVFFNTYGLMTVPFTAFFDKNKRLKVAYMGRMPAHSLFQL